MRGSTRFRDQIVNMLAYAKDSPERFELPIYARTALERGLEQYVAAPNAADELSNVLALAIALETELESPSVGQQLRELLKSDPRAVRLVQNKYAKRDSLDEARRFQQQEGRATALAAPLMVASAPAQAGSETNARQAIHDPQAKRLRARAYTVG